jgi:tRNA threonylcarbamoyladenosine biosynthesis protein TsaE
VNATALTLDDEAATFALGVALGGTLRAGDVVTLSGPLGAGKTSLVRGMLAALGFAGEAPSPSFALVIAYEPPDVLLPLWHVDLYRIESPAEIVELGLDDARADSALAIEWPELADEDAWPDALKLAIAPDGAGRRLTWSAPAAWQGRWPPPRS